MFKALDHVSTLQELYKSITFLKAEMLLFIKKGSLNFTSGNEQELIKLGKKLLSDPEELQCFFKHSFRFALINCLGFIKKFNVFNSWYKY